MRNELEGFFAHPRPGGVGATLLVRDARSA